MSSQYIFDKDDIKFRKKRTSVWAVVRRILVFFVATASMAVLYYLVFALFFSTEQQQRLRDENRSILSFSVRNSLSPMLSKA